jgi:hypothetical protein
MGVLRARQDYQGKRSEELNAREGEEFTLISDKHAGWFYVSSTRTQSKGYLPTSLFDQSEQSESDDDQKSTTESSYASDNGTMTTDYTNSTRYSSDESGDDSSEGANEDSDDSNYEAETPLIARRLSTILRPRSNSTVESPASPLSAHPGLKMSILGRFCAQSHGRMSKTVFPQMNAAQTDFRDLVWDPRKKGIKKFKTKCLAPVIVKEVRNLPATLENVKLFDHKLRMALFDKSAVLSNVYTATAHIANKTWKFNEKTVQSIARV